MTALAEERAPPYGRFDLMLQVHPFGPAEAALMLPDLRPGDRALVYGLLGGMPLYLSCWDQARGVTDNLAPVLYAIAAGRSRHNKIRDALGTEPIRTLDRGMGDSILPVLVEHLDDHMGRVWEDAFRSHVRTVTRTGGWPAGFLAPEEPVVAVGPWWSTDGGTEIDLVGLAGRARTPVVAGEATWAQRIDGTRVGRALQRDVQRLPGSEADADLPLLLCTREAVDNPPPGVGVVTAADMFPTTGG